MTRKDRWPELCDLVSGDDRLPVRESGPWTEDKLFYWNRYIEITTGGMRYHWPSGLVYVDLFAGPGVCVNEESGRRFPGSPLLAAKAPVPFRKIVLVELDKERAAACETRVRSISSSQDLVVIQGDCNDVIDRVVSAIPTGTLTLALVDPDSLHVRFGTLRRLAARGHVDLLILFPIGYDILRNIGLYELQDESRLDDVLGGSPWRTDWAEVVNRQSSKVVAFFTEEYKRRLTDEIGYKVVADTSIKHKGKLFYKLVYASMSERGVDFWRKAVQKERSGQMGWGF